MRRDWEFPIGARLEYRGDYEDCTVSDG
ncbi:hypothetical protein EYZ11_008532 [Aspergillus tanneri]|uniref:Uncharacterized protein n=1 Tax=Aspergillus tanneri TaxID=1220188 RepID=A0A4S3JAK2_9EURO|nr:hypothetical protein EYZ11_008532 [Aspergillus tanneri]